MDLKKAAQSLFDHPSRKFPVKLWDGTLLPPPSGSVRGAVVFGSPSAMAALFPPASEQRIANAFISGDIELEGDAIDLIEAVALWEGPNRRVGLAVALAAWLQRAFSATAGGIAASLHGRRHSQDRDRKAVQHHYDVSNEFYQLFLDPAMVYSCGYFPSGFEPLETAQRYKLDLICRKLDLKRDERFLDIGCGWGALLLHAASAYSARALGVTLSNNQLTEATRRRQLADSADRVEIRAQDYRQLGPAGTFDKIASVGMMEHVGRARLDGYFQSVFRLLRPGGLFLNHAIADIASGVRTIAWLPQRRRTFIQQYIFPDSELIPIGEVAQAAERAGFEVRDVECIREHYADTLVHWLARLERRFDEAVAIVGNARARAWRLYLATSAVGFRIGRTGVYQMLLAKRLADGRAAGVPRFRARWYENLLEQSGPTPERELPFADPGRPALRAAPSAKLSAGGENGVHSGEPTS
jgi:cyclopropane-fatty-acyl-phospholipid synthase